MIRAVYRVIHACVRNRSADVSRSFVKATYTAVDDDNIADSSPIPATTDLGASSASSAEPDAALMAAWATRATISPLSRRVFIYACPLVANFMANQSPTSVKVSDGSM